MGLFGSVSSAVSSVTSKASSLKNVASGYASKAGSLKDSATGLASKAGSLKNSAMGLKDKATGKLSGAASSLTGGGFAGGVATGPGGVSSTGYLFSVEIGEFGEQMRFEECTGLEVSCDIVEVEEGGFNDGTHKFYGTTHYGNIVLRKGIAYRDNALFDIIDTYVKSQDTAAGLTASIAVKKLHDTDDEIARWNLYDVRPCRWSIGKLVAKDKYAVEYIELAVGSVEHD